MVFNATFNNISVTTYTYIMVVSFIGGENPDYQTDLTLSHNAVSSTPRHEHDSNSQL